MNSGNGQRRDSLAEGFHDAPGVWLAEVLIGCGPERQVRHTRPYTGSSLSPFTWDGAREKFRRYAGAIVGAVAGPERAVDMADVAQLVALA